MASLGDLVSGVAHEINTPVGVVNSAATASAMSETGLKVTEIVRFSDISLIGRQRRG